VRDARKTMIVVDAGFEVFLVVRKEFFQVEMIGSLSPSFPPTNIRTTS
jgi:hypothetical protein